MSRRCAGNRAGQLQGALGGIRGIVGVLGLAHRKRFLNYGGSERTGRTAWNRLFRSAAAAHLHVFRCLAIKRTTLRIATE